MAMIVCPECGKSVSEYAQACPECGYPISATHGVVKPQASIQATSMSQSKIDHVHQYSKKHLLMFIAIGLAAIFAIGILIGSFFFPSLGETKSKNEISHTTSQASTESTSPPQELITSVSQLTDAQLICDTNGVKIWAMNMVLDTSYGVDDPYWELTCYMENNSGHPLHTQFNHVDVNGGFGIDLRGINNEGNLSDGQKGIFHMHVAASDLAPYGIEKIESLSGLVWIIDSDTWDKVVDDAPFNISIDNIGNVYSLY